MPNYHVSPSLFIALADNSDIIRRPGYPLCNLLGAIDLVVPESLFKFDFIDSLLASGRILVSSRPQYLSMFLRID